MSEGNEKILQLDNVSYIYGAKKSVFRKVAVNGVSLEIERGRLYGIIGHTGSGKSTLIQMMNGLLKPESGRVIVEGVDINASKKSSRGVCFKVGIVFQYPEYQLFEESVYKDIAFGPTNMGLSAEQVKERVFSAMDLLSLDRALADHSPFALSGEQKRKVAIAGVVAMMPDLLILDEPASGLDPAGREEVFAFLSDYIKKQNAAVVVVSHSMEDMAIHADRIFVMHEGALLMQGDADTVFSQSQTLGDIGLDVPEVTRLVARLRAAGYDIPENIYTPERAREAILALAGRGRGNE